MSKHLHVHQEDLGRVVKCDVCNEEWTDRTESGGFLFTSYAYCPDCAKSRYERILEYNEQHLIKAWCPPGQSFADWCRSLRQGNNNITVYKWENQ